MNMDTILLAAIAGLPATIAAIAALVQAAKTHKAVNSRMTELLEITRQAATDKATLAEKDAARMRRGEAAVQTALDESKKP